MSGGFDAYLLASYSAGSFVKVNLPLVARVLVQISLGMGIFGFLIHYALLAGIGSKTLYMIMLIIPTFVQRTRIQLTISELLDSYHRSKNKFASFLTFACIAIIIIMGNTTIRWADALAKYLSVVTYAAENGVWKTNIVESIIYADQFTMYCSLATLGVALGANRFFI